MKIYAYPLLKIAQSFAEPDFRRGYPQSGDNMELYRSPLQWSEPCENPICTGSGRAWNKYVDVKYEEVRNPPLVRKVEVTACCRQCASLMAENENAGRV